MLCEARRWFFQDGTGRKVLTIFPLSGFKGACGLAGHKCVCWLSAKVPPGRKPLEDLLRWAHSGIGLGENEHITLGDDLKVAYGMRIRRR